METVKVFTISEFNNFRNYNNILRISVVRGQQMLVFQPNNMSGSFHATNLYEGTLTTTITVPKEFFSENPRSPRNRSISWTEVEQIEFTLGKLVTQQHSWQWFSCVNWKPGIFGLHMAIILNIMSDANKLCTQSQMNDGFGYYCFTVIHDSHFTIHLLVNGKRKNPQFKWDV